MIDAAMRADLPNGTVTFLFTDVEGSTKLLHSLGAEGYAQALAEHRRLIREACAHQGGVEVDTQGDAFFFAFPSAQGALVAAEAMTETLAAGPIQVRIGLHSGTPLLTEEGYVGDDVHFGARVAASGHGGQVIVSGATRGLLEPSDKSSQGVSLLDLGEHRLKDIPQAVPIYQLGEGSFPPLKTISNTNLPRPASSFVGREAELQEVLSRVEQGARLVTLSGPGGSGKTRLALEAAATLVPSYKAGVFWVGLASLRDPALVSESISQTLGAKDGLQEHIGERELLLLLDNLEQVIEAAPELSTLLQACPNLTLLVTSRELLRVQGEVEYPVPPLASPEAVALFCARAQVEPSDEIAELCARLDNLPLAVELAAARTKALSPAQILERLSSRLDLLQGGRDADPRQQTLRATIEWSYDLLSPGEQELFSRLSVFSGGCTLEAAEKVADADLDTLQSLVEKSLLRFTSERYWMLEMIREFAGERLERYGNPRELREHHLDWVRAFALKAREELRGDRQIESLEFLSAEHANVRAALTFAIGDRDVQRALAIAGSLGRFWIFRGHDREGLRWLEDALALPHAKRDDHRWRALYWAGTLADSVGDRRAARALTESSLELARELGDGFAVAASAVELARRVLSEGERQRAEALLGEAAELALQQGDERGQAVVAFIRGQIRLVQGDAISAASYFERGLELDRRVGDIQGVAIGLAYLGLAQAGCRTVSQSFLRESLRICADLRMAYGVAICLQGAAEIAMHEGDFRSAAALQLRADGLYDEVGIALTGVEGELHRQTWTRIRERIDRAHLEELQDDISSGDFDEALAYGIDFIDSTA